MNNYDSIAPVYDLLAHIVFFGKIKKSKNFGLDRIRDGSKILIIGGGSGYILELIRKTLTSYQVTYVETSRRMIAKAKKRSNSDRIEYFNQDFLDFYISDAYDVVICNYFFDLFNKNTLTIVLDKVKEALRDEGLLLVSDFQVNNQIWWHQPLYNTMHWFFKNVSQLQSDRLLPMREILKDRGFEKQSSKKYFGGFMFSASYKKRS